MSTIARAAQIIRDHGSDPCREPECIAQDLADAGLLAPDTAVEFDENGIWQECGEEPELFVLSKGLPVGFAAIGVFDRDENRFNVLARPVAETREFAHALLAAADHAEAGRE